jgi:hypothetical protein
MENASVFARIIKADKQADGTLLVTGIATDSSLDVDEQICDPEWLKSAMPEWFKWGNIREQHSNIAAGVATEYTEEDGRHLITARVVEPTSVKKVETGVLKGFSIGIRGPRVVRDNKAAGGRIIDGQIVEVSLVDRPANPVCTIALAKTINGSIAPVEELTVKADEMTEESTETKVIAEETEETAEEVVADETDESQADEESSQAVGEESSQAIGEESSREGGVAGVAGKADEMAALHGKFDMLAEMVAKMYDKMCGPDESAEKSPSEDITKAVTEVADRLSVLEKSVTAATAPVRMAVKSAEPKVDERAALAQAYRAKAMAASDPKLAEGYLSLALEHEHSTL